MRVVFCIVVALGLSGLAGCITRAAEPVQVRVLVKLHNASSEPAVLQQQASAIAGVPVQYAASVGGQWHALALRCTDIAECDAAVQRLRADTSAFQNVQRDERRRAGS